jgi:DNA-binding transcriptional LysR family regulator
MMPEREHQRDKFVRLEVQTLPGLAAQPQFTVWEDVAAGRLEQVLTEWSLPLIALHMVTPPVGLRPARVGVLIDLLVKRLAAAPWAR